MMAGLSPGDHVFVVMPSHHRQIPREYDFRVETSFDGSLVLCPLSNKPAQDQDPFENPWRKFCLTRHGLRIGEGADARTYEPQKRK